MSRHLLFVLLLATGVALADDRPKAKHNAGAAQAQSKKEVAQGRTEHAQTKRKTAQQRTAEAPAKTKKEQGQTEHTQTKTEAAQEQTAEPQKKTKTAQEQTEEGQTQTEGDGKLVSVPGGKALGMSILGNQDAPKSLVIVPWKSSELGNSPGIAPMLDDSRQPVDREVFMRALRYYEIRSETKP
jgi:hypothetical protein